MAELERYNLRHEEVLDHIKDILVVNREYYGGVDIRCVSIEQNASWYNALCLVRVYPSVEKRENVSSQRYPHVHLLAEQKEVDHLFTFLDRIKFHQIEVDSETVTIGERTEFYRWSLLPGMNDYFDLPGYLYESGKTSVQELNRPLIQYDLPYYPDVHHAIKDWLGIREFHYYSDSRIGSILLFLPGCLAKFEKFDIENGILRIYIENKKGFKINPLRLKGAWDVSGEYKPISFNILNTEIQLEIPEHTTGLDLYLIDSNDSIFDYHCETRFWSKGQQRVLVARIQEEGEPQEAVEKAIRIGESEQIEFKPYIDKNNPKIIEIIKTVIAFANTKGGTIFLGIDNHCCVQGIERDVSRKDHRLQKKEDQQYEEYKGDLLQTLNSALNRTLPVELSFVNFRDHTILLIEVPEGKEKPYANRNTKEIFIRKSSNNARPDPDYELPQLIIPKKE